MTPSVPELRFHNQEPALEASHAADSSAHGTLGIVPNLHGTLGESPAALGAFGDLSERFAKTRLTPLEQRVVHLTAAHTNRCHYCTVPRNCGDLDPESAARWEQVSAAIRGERRIEDRRLQSLRRFTAAVTEQRGWVPQAAVEDFLEAGYTRESVLEVLLGVSLVTLASYASHIAATPIEASAGQRMLS